jgi:glycosyltransferase involved in cell wall biosynthesis
LTAFSNVDVLLATYNGERFLSEFLISLKNQVGVRIRLIISDDGSTDSTLKILESFENSFSSLEVHQGPRKGPAANFSYLLTKSNSAYIAFADQDDIWEPEHLLNSIKRILPYNSIPALTFSPVREFGVNLEDPEIWPKEVPKTFTGYFAQNYARGCTIVFNSSCRNLYLQGSPKAIIMHDWWALLIALSCGKVIFSERFEVNYRIHQENFTIRRKTSTILFQFPKRRDKWEPIEQLECFREIYGSMFAKGFQVECDSFIAGARGHFLVRLRYFLCNRNMLRLDPLQNFLLKIGLLFFPLLFGRD